MLLTAGFGKFRLLASDALTHRRSAPMATPALLNPNNANPLEQGEWLVRDSTDPTKFERFAVSSGAGPVSAVPAVAPKGSTDCQAIGATEVYTGVDGLLAETTSYSVGTAPVVGSLLQVLEVTEDTGDGSRALSMLVVTTTENDNVVAIVEEPPADYTAYDPMVIRLTSQTAPA